MWGLYKETDAATGVEGALWCHLLSSAESHLVVWGANHLRVFRLNPFLPPAPDSDAPRTGLELLLSHTLLSPIAALAAAAVPGDTRDCLLLSFAEAKLAVLAYDPASHSLATISLHAFEDELLRAGFTRDIPLPLLAADPDGRCAALLVYGRHLALLPLTAKAPEAGYDELDALTSGGGGGAPCDSQKLPSLALFSYVVALEAIEERLGNVVDMAFLHGYYEPTLLFLFEPAQTTAGRVAVRQDTFCILAVSLNVKDRVQAVIWTVHSLPFDCLRCFPVPKPIGGILLIAENSVIYLNQSVPAYGISVNSRLRGATSFPLRNQEDKKLSLEVATGDFIIPSTMAIGTTGGDVWILTLLIDNTSVVKGMQLDQSSVNLSSDSTAVRACSDGWVFFGSRLGDSHLVRYWEEDSYPVRVSNEPVAKDLNDTSIANGAAAPATNGDPMDDLAIYGEVVAVETVDTMRVTAYGLAAADALLCTGPVRDLTLGIPPLIPLPLQTQQMDPIIDVVLASGHEKSGSVTVIQKQVRPSILTSSTIPGAVELFTVGRRPAALSQEDEEAGALPASHRFLLVSKQVGTMVLELGLEISELETSGFCMEQRTIAAADFCDGQFIIQVCAMSVVLLCGSARLESAELDISFPIASATFAEPYAVLLTENGELLFLALEEEHLVLSRPTTGTIAATAVAAYVDRSGLFQLSNGGTLEQRREREKKEAEAKAKKELEAAAPKAKGSRSAEPKTVEDEDALLYGYDDKENKPKIFAESALIPPDIYFEGRAIVTTLQDPASVPPTSWVAVSRENGLLEIFTLPDFKPVFLCKKFPHCYPTLYDHDPFQFNVETETARAPDDHFPIVRELWLGGLGPNGVRPHLIGVVGEEVVVYEAFAFDEGYPDHLGFRFKKIAHEIVIRNERVLKGRKRPFGAPPERTSGDSQLEPYTRLLHPFSGVATGDARAAAGLFFAGPYPYWVLMGEDGALRAHPMSADGPLLSLAPFHNHNCREGFLYLTKASEMRICQLSRDVSLASAASPIRRVHLGRTVHGIEYLLDSNTYAVASSTTVPNNKIVSLNGEEKQFEEVDKSGDPNYILPTVRQYKVQVFDPETWAPVPKSGDVELEEFEQITVFKEVQLNSEGTISGLQNYLAIGTIINYGEEVLVRGRILLCEVIEVVPEPGEPLTRRKIKTLYAKEQKGPVTSVCSVAGYLLTALASKVYIWNFRDSDLVGISFIDMQFYIHGMVGLRNFAFVADVYKSASLLRYQEYAKALSLACRDARTTPVQAMPMGIDYLIDNQEVGLLMADEDKNISILCYQPEDTYSNAGQRLVPNGDMQIGTRVAAFARLQSHVSDPVVENKSQAVHRHLNLFGTLDGHLAFITPIQERMYRRLHTLQVALISHIPHLGGLNPKGARSLRGMRGGTFTPQKNIVDGNLVFQYLHLSVVEKADLAKRIGSTKEQLLDDLLEIQRMSTPF